MIYDILFRSKDEFLLFEDMKKLSKQKRAFLDRVMTPTFPFKDSIQFLQTCRQVWREASHVLYTQHTFKIFWKGQNFPLFPFGGKDYYRQPSHLLNSLRRVKIVMNQCLVYRTVFSITKLNHRACYFVDELLFSCKQSSLTLDVLELWMRDEKAEMSQLTWAMETFLAAAARVAHGFMGQKIYSLRRLDALNALIANIVALPDAEILESLEMNMVGIRLTDIHASDSRGPAQFLITPIASI